MSDEKKTKVEKKLVSRREVLAGAGATIVSGALMASGALAASNETEKKAGKAAAKNTDCCNVPLDEQVWDFEKKPDPIPSSKIKETITADIVIVGTGASGMPCAAAASMPSAKGPKRWMRPRIWRRLKKCSQKRARRDKSMPRFQMP